MRDRILSFALDLVGLVFLRRDRLNGSMKRLLDAFAFDQGRLTIRSGGRKLSAVYVRASDDAPVFLICHGIGEQVEYWSGVQELLKAMEISSLVFNYSGYGASSGRVSVAHCEEDAIAAYRELKDRGHRCIFLLGFSLGSGVVLAVAPRLKIDGVILCQGYSTLREAALAMGFRRWMTYAMPDVWHNLRQLNEITMPVLVVHSDRDQLFPVAMAKRVHKACGESGELIIVSGFAHDGPVYFPTEAYWRPVVEWANRMSTKILAEELPAGD
ncbi:alpha/beta hydrolase [Tunturiibacter gelidiferens]|uniref:alpha/beta hydrolase n=1 Tax=Tunturiibacter gelidiferens TaxID=3069689 RepID=UPI003D9B1449